MNHTMEFNERNNKIVRYTIIKTLSDEVEKDLSNKAFIILYPRIIEYAKVLTEEIERAILANETIGEVRNRITEERDEVEDQEAINSLVRTKPEDIEFETGFDADPEEEDTDGELESNLEFMLNGQFVNRKSVRKALTSGNKEYRTGKVKKVFKPRFLGSLRSKSQRKRIASLIKAKRK